MKAVICVIELVLGEFRLPPAFKPLEEHNEFSNVLVHIPWDSSFIPRIGDTLHLMITDAVEVKRVEIHNRQAIEIEISVDDEKGIGRFDVDPDMLYSLVRADAHFFQDGWTLTELLLKYNLPLDREEFKKRFPEEPV